MDSFRDKVQSRFDWYVEQRKRQRDDLKAVIRKTTEAFASLPKPWTWDIQPAGAITLFYAGQVITTFHFQEGVSVSYSWNQKLRQIEANPNDMEPYLETLARIIADAAAERVNI